MQKSRFFHAVQTGAAVGGGTVIDLIDWLHFFVDLSVPDHGVEWWDCGASRSSHMFRPAERVPAIGKRPGDYAYPVCYWRTGDNEGRRIEVGLRGGDGVIKLLDRAKSFGTEAQCAEVSRACQTALESILLYRRVPEIVGLARKLPRKGRSDLVSSLNERVVVQHSSTALTVVSASGTVFDERNWDDPQVGKGEAEALLLDWQSVLRTMQVDFLVDGALLSNLESA